MNGSAPQPGGPPAGAEPD